MAAQAASVVAAWEAGWLVSQAAQVALASTALAVGRAVRGVASRAAQAASVVAAWEAGWLVSLAARAAVLAARAAVAVGRAWEASWAVEE